MKWCRIKGEKILLSGGRTRFTRQWKTNANNFPYAGMMPGTVPGQLYIPNMFHGCWLKILAHSKLEHSACIATTESLVSVHGPCLFYHVRHKSICLLPLLLWEIHMFRKKEKWDLVIALYCWMNYSYMKLVQTCHAQFQSSACLTKSVNITWANVAKHLSVRLSGLRREICM